MSAKKFSDDELRAWVRDGLTGREMATRAGASTTAISLRLRRLGLATRQRRASADRATYDADWDTEAELAAAFLDAMRQSLPEPWQCERVVTVTIPLEDSPVGVEWHTSNETADLLKMMSPVNLAKVDAAKRAGRVMVGGIYKRTRREPSGVKQQRAEVRFDDIAGCLRTPGGGSSRQVILVVDGKRVRSRLISARETARLMGLPESYKLPARYNEAYHLTGDGVVVPVVRHLAAHLLEPLIGAATRL